MSKYGCDKCANKHKPTKEEFIEKANQIHNNKYDYSKIDYVNNKTKIEIVCPIHGSFWQIPDNHINQKQGCPLCGNNVLTEKQYIEFAKQVHKNYIYSNINFKGMKSNINVICPIHGSFFQRADHHLFDFNGCPKCNYSTGERIIAEYLDENNINYVYQEYFDDCRSDKGRIMPFDFYIKDYNLVIEYQGEQHYSDRGLFGNLKETRHRDWQKRKYAREKNIDYLSISFYNIKRIKEILDENFRKSNTKRIP